MSALVTAAAGTAAGAAADLATDLATGHLPLVLLAPVLVGAAAWLLLPRPRAAAGTRVRREARVEPGRVSGPAHPVAPPPRWPLRRARPVPREPAAVAVARAAAEVAALVRAGALPAAAWAPQRAGSSPLSATPGPGPDPGPGPGAGAARRPDAVRGALDAAARAAAEGGDPAAALRRHGGAGAAAPALAALALAWRTSEVTGAPAAAVLEELAGSLREEAAAADARDAALAGPRATARLLLVLPVLGLVASTAVGADPLGALLGTAPGRWCGGAGLACAITGWVWTSALVRAAERAR